MSSKINVYKNDSKKTYELTPEKISSYRETSKKSRLAKLAADRGEHAIIHVENIPKLYPNTLMPLLPSNGLKTLSLFAGGGGLDLGFDRAGFDHLSSYELIPICGDTLKTNRPKWNIYSGVNHGDVTKIDWSNYSSAIDVIHGGPPCQPFSIAGNQLGLNDERNMWGEFSRAINTIKPRAFVAENVLGLLTEKFEHFVKSQILDVLSDYHIKMFEMNSVNYGVPQIRRRVFFVGFRNKKAFDKFDIPEATHRANKKGSELNGDLFNLNKPQTIGVREALGLEDLGYDSYAPTIRSGFTGKRNTTSILNSQALRKILLLKLHR